MTNKKRRITSLRIEEISGVDKAAQVPAEALLRKRAPKGKADCEDCAPGKPCPEHAMGKHFEYTRPMLTSNVAGHQHVLDDVGAGGDTSYVRSEGEEYGHSHSWVRMLDGTVAIGAAEGHTHEVIDFTNKSASGGDSKEPETMTQQTPEALAKSVADLTTRAERAEAILKLSADERGVFDGLDQNGQTAFLAKSATERESLVKNAQSANAVVYKSRNGDEFRKNDDPRLIKMAKDRDAETERTEKALADLAMERLTKRAADEMAHCPGSIEERAGILKALTGVPGAEAFVKAADAALKGNFKPQGVKGDGSEVLKAADRYEALAKAYATEHKVSIEVARDQVLDTPEGLKLYTEMNGESA